MHSGQKQATFLVNVPTLWKSTIKRAFDGQGSPRQAIKAKCLDCSNFQREEVKECPVFLCPLWPWRPFQADRQKRKGRPPAPIVE